jgi:benzoate/toluate 1,2-dioxygenase alpha subunit
MSLQPLHSHEVAHEPKRWKTVTTSSADRAVTAETWIDDDTPKRFRVRSAAYSDADIYEREMEDIFESTWVYVCHESEISKVGDFRSTWIGRQPVIVARGRDKAINIMLNVCRHRANAICRVEYGNVKIFQCPYHGWSYGLDGQLAGITDRTRYPEDLKDKISGLVKVPRVHSYRGLVFASLSPDVADFHTHFAAVLPYIDAWADLSIGEEWKVGTPHKFAYPGNWKFQVENSLDGYHGRFVHESGFAALAYDPDASEGDEAAIADRHYMAFDTSASGCTRGIPGGHGTLESARSGDAKQIGVAKVSDEAFEQYHSALVAAYGEERARALLASRHIAIFPNLVLMDLNIRTITPLSAERTLVSSYFVEAGGVPDSVNAERLADLQIRLGTTGFVGLDDLEMFGGNQTGTTANGMEWLELSRGIETEAIAANGERVGAASDETPFREFWRQWSSLIQKKG